LGIMLGEIRKKDSLKIRGKTYERLTDYFLSFVIANALIVKK
jgi:hypothetical protein